MSEVELIEFGELPEGFDLEQHRKMTFRAMGIVFPEMPIAPCRICVVADATGNDDLCDTCRAAVISRRLTYTPLPAGDLQRKEESGANEEK